MAKHLVKCLYCGQTFDINSEPYVKPNSTRYAHKECAETIGAEKTKEQKDKEQLESYIKELFKIDKITSKIRKQIDTYKKENNYTYSGMYKTLKYFYDVKGNTTEKSNGGIGIIPWIYNEAFDYWRGLWEIQQQNQNVEIQKFVLPVKEIHIQPPKREPMKHIRKLFSFLEEDKV